MLVPPFEDGPFLERNIDATKRVHVKHQGLKIDGLNFWCDSVFVVVRFENFLKPCKWCRKLQEVFFLKIKPPAGQIGNHKAIANQEQRSNRSRKWLHRRIRAKAIKPGQMTGNRQKMLEKPGRYKRKWWTLEEENQKFPTTEQKNTNSRSHVIFLEGLLQKTYKWVLDQLNPKNSE